MHVADLDATAWPSSASTSSSPTPSHLDSIISAIKRVDSVYAAYRVLPGHARAGALMGDDGSRT